MPCALLAACLSLSPRQKLLLPYFLTFTAYPSFQKNNFLGKSTRCMWGNIVHYFCRCRGGGSFCILQMFQFKLATLFLLVEQSCCLPQAPGICRSAIPYTMKLCVWFQECLTLFLGSAFPMELCSLKYPLAMVTPETCPGKGIWGSATTHTVPLVHGSHADSPVSATSSLTTDSITTCTSLHGDRDATEVLAPMWISKMDTNHLTKHLEQSHPLSLILLNVWYFKPIHFPVVESFGNKNVKGVRETCKVSLLCKETPVLKLLFFTNFYAQEYITSACFGHFDKSRLLAGETPLQSIALCHLAWDETLRYIW